MKEMSRATISSSTVPHSILASLVTNAKPPGLSKKSSTCLHIAKKTSRTICIKEERRSRRVLRVGIARMVAAAPAKTKDISNVISSWLLGRKPLGHHHRHWRLKSSDFPMRIRNKDNIAKSPHKSSTLKRMTITKLLMTKII